MNNGQKRFVIHEHSTDESSHWDLMLEVEKILQTFRLDKSPRQILLKSADAEKIHDHPLKFLTYQGPVQNGRAIVKIVDSGTYKITHQTIEKFDMNLTGQILSGKFTLTLLADNKYKFTCQKT